MDLIRGMYSIIDEKTGFEERFLNYGIWCHYRTVTSKKGLSTNAFKLSNDLLNDLLEYDDGVDRAEHGDDNVVTVTSIEVVQRPICKEAANQLMDYSVPAIL